MKHTPGPWESDRAAVYSTSDAIKDHRVCGYGFGDNGFICDLDDGEYHEYSDYEEMQANARLIAAAPDMLEALERIVDMDVSGPGELAGDMRDVARAAIAKARGGE